MIQYVNFKFLSLFVNYFHSIPLTFFSLFSLWTLFESQNHLFCSWLVATSILKQEFLQLLIHTKIKITSLGLICKPYSQAFSSYYFIFKERLILIMSFINLKWLQNTHKLRLPHFISAWHMHFSNQLDLSQQKMKILNYVKGSAFKMLCQSFKLINSLKRYCFMMSLFHLSCKTMCKVSPALILASWIVVSSLSCFPPKINLIWSTPMPSFSYRVSLI